MIESWLAYLLDVGFKNPVRMQIVAEKINE
jgi:hypothetical protein